MLRRIFVLVTFLCAGCGMNNEQHFELSGPWSFRADSLDEGLSAQWFAADFDRSAWSEVKVPDHWERYNLPSYDGTGWFTTRFTHDDSSEPMALFFAGVDDDADIWLNGEKIGSHAGYSEAFFFDVTRALRKGVNTLVVRVVDYSGPGGIYRPVAVIPLKDVEELLRSPYADLPARPSADWVKDAVIYEVYLRSFSKEGTFKALERKIPELKDLGVTVLWLMPIHPVGTLHRKGTLGSPYAVMDYYAINPEFGTLDDFRSLVNTVHKHDLKIIIDLVANHTSWDSKLLREHPEWFTKDSTGKIVAPNTDWTDVADLDYDQPEVRDYMIRMMEYWIRDIGIDGYRCDVAELVPTDFWERARKVLDKIKPVLLLSEGTVPEHHVRAFDITYAWNFYDVLSRVIQGSAPATLFADIHRNEALQFPRGSLRMRFTTNHDKNAWDAPAVEKFTPEGAKAGAVLAFTFGGVPLIYNGEEVGNAKRLHLFEKVEIDWNRNPEFRSLFTQLTRLRREHAAFRRGTFESLDHSEPERVVAFRRRQGTETAIVIVNLSRESLEVSVTLPEPVSDLKEWLTGKDIRVSNGRLKIELDSFAYRVFVGNIPS
ncbi:MAG: hypothetical protein HBSIN02_04120 [Bacteroidia bacterium]|nr:MAG: hypothetical protein HBSIN02_04120 [Bacteroidia bacterium]